MVPEWGKEYFAAAQNLFMSKTSFVPGSLKRLNHSLLASKTLNTDRPLEKTHPRDPSRFRGGEWHGTGGDGEGPVRPDLTLWGFLSSSLTAVHCPYRQDRLIYRHPLLRRFFFLSNSVMRLVPYLDSEAVPGYLEIQLRGRQVRCAPYFHALQPYKRLAECEWAPWGIGNRQSASNRCIPAQLVQGDNGGVFRRKPMIGKPVHWLSWNTRVFLVLKDLTL